MTENILTRARVLLMGLMAVMMLSACGVEDNQKWERVEYEGDIFSDERTAGRKYKYVLVDMASEKGPVLETILEETKDFAPDMNFILLEETTEEVFKGEFSEEGTTTIIITKDQKPEWTSPLVPRETTMLPRISRKISLEPIMPAFVSERATPVVNRQENMMIERATPIFNEDQKVEYASQKTVEDTVEETVEVLAEPEVVRKSIYEDADFLFEKRMVK